MVQTQVQVRVHDHLAPGARAQVMQFLDAARARGQRGLDDHLSSDLAHAADGPYRAVIATVDGTTGDAAADVRGYAQASEANEGLLVGCVVLPGERELQALLLRTLLSHLPADCQIVWWSTDESAAEAADLGMIPDRRLLRMTRPLPIAATSAATVRPFLPGADEAAWLEVNNAAFAWHGEQGGWDLQQVQQREHEPWFDPAGFLLHERDGRLAAFCWTKLHAGTPLVGEIYVIAVHPDFHGLGLGRALTVAGLQHLQSVGATAAMLYVDADNTAAVGLYRDLGFEVAHTDQSFLRPPRGAAS
jgi:mycothiol synthase